MSKKQSNIILDTVAAFPGDRVIIQEQGDACITTDVSAKKLKFEPSNLVVSRFRIFSFKKGKTLDKDFPILFVTEISGKDKRAAFKVEIPNKPAVVLVINCDAAERLVYNVRETLQRITFGWPGEKKCVCAFEGASQLSEFDPGPAHGFEHTYEAYCNFFGTPLRTEVVEHVNYLVSIGCTDLDLTAIPGIDLKSELTFEMLPVAATLKNNTYWRSIEMRGIEHKEALSAFAHILSENRTITKVVCSNCASDIVELFGQAMEKNVYNKVHILDLSGNKIAVKAAESLALAFQSSNHVIQVINLNNISLGSSGFQSIILALSINWGMTLGIEELNISNNMIGTASGDFISFIGLMKKHCKIRRLALANTGIQVGSFILELSSLKITYLDLSDNKFDKLTQNNLVHFCEGTQTLETIRLANTSLGAQMLARVVKTLFENDTLKSISIDLSRNSLGLAGVQQIVPFLRNAKLNAFDLSDNAIKEKGLIEVVKSIKYVNRLVLDRNFGDKEGTDELATALASFVSSHPELYHLSLAGSKESKLNKISRNFLYYCETTLLLKNLTFLEIQWEMEHFQHLSQC
jgi:Ran GTPase-activating protein (RanGAP) involved in mRNA processing and transport